MNTLLAVLILPVFLLSCAGVQVTKKAPEPAVRHVTVLFSGNTDGHLEPVCCGSRNRGGFARKAYFANALRRACPGVLYVETGGLFDKNHDPEKIRYMTALLNHLQPAALNVAAEDAVVLRGQPLTMPLLSANIRSSAGGEFLFRQFLTTTIGNTRIGIFGVAEPSGDFSGFYVEDPVVSARNAVARLQSLGCSVILMLSNLSKEKNTDLSGQISGIDFILAASEEPGHFSGEMPAGQAAAVLMTNTLGRDLGVLSLNIEAGGAHFENITVRDVIAEKIERLEYGQVKALTGVDPVEYCRHLNRLFSASRGENAYMFTIAALDRAVGKDPDAALIVEKYRESRVKKQSRDFLYTVPTLDLSGLSETQRLTALRLLNQIPCGQYPSSIARSAAADLFCRELGNMIIHAVQSGKTEGEIAYRILYKTELRKILDNRPNVQ